MRDVLIIGGACKVHDWKHVGGANCGCEWIEDGERCGGGCSVPVHRCGVCGDYDYGDNEEANAKRKRCADTGHDEMD